MNKRYMNQINRYMTPPQQDVSPEQHTNQETEQSSHTSVPTNTMNHIRNVVSNFFKKED